MSTMYRKACAEAISRTGTYDMIALKHHYVAGPLRRRRVSRLMQQAQARGLAVSNAWLDRAFLFRDAVVDVRGEWIEVLKFAQTWDEEMG